MYLILTQSPDLIRTRLDGFMQFDSALIWQVHDHMASHMPTQYFQKPEEEPRARPIVVNVKAFEGKEGENLSLWIRVAERAMNSDIPNGETAGWDGYLKLGGRAREWALTSSTYVDEAFLHDIC